MEKILAFIPCYNCEKQVVRVLGQFNKRIMQYVDEIIVVNNRSLDNTENAVLEFCRTHQELPVKLLRNDENYSLGGSHKVAFNYAVENGFSHVIVLHGDDQGRISDFLPVLESKLYQNYDCVLGSRFMKGSTLPGYSKFRTFGNIVYNWAFSCATFTKVKDLGSGLNMYSTKMLENHFYEKFSDTLMFNCYMLLANSYFKLKVRYYPISWREEDQVSNVKMISQAFKTIKIPLGYFFSRKSKYMKKDFRTKMVDNYTAKIVNQGETSGRE